MGASSSRGFTLIELVVTVSVLAVLLVIAVPSFTEFRQRAGLRGASEQVVSFWGDARFEALRRNSLIKVVFQESSGAFCIGARTTTAASAATDTCNCLTAGSCSVGQFPTDQSQWRGVRVAAAATIGGDSGGLVIDPKRGALLDADDVGRVFLRSSTNGNGDYRLNVVFDRNGRAIECEPTDAPDKLPQYTNKRC